MPSSVEHIHVIVSLVSHVDNNKIIASRNFGYHAGNINLAMATGAQWIGKWLKRNIYGIIAYLGS